MKDKNKECTPKLRFPEFREAGEWETCYIKDVADVLSGYVFPNKYQGKKFGDYPFYKVSDISSAQKNGIYITCASNYIDLDTLRTIKAKTIPKHTIIFAKIGETARLNRQSITTLPSVIDNNIAGIKAKNKIISYLFLYYLIQKVDFNEFIAAGAVPAINKSTIEQIQIKIPLPSEQQKIADCLSSLDELIEAHEQKCEALRQHKKGLMQRLFPAEGETTPRWRFPEFREAGEWEKKTLGKIAINLDSKRIPITFTKRHKGIVPYYGASGIVDYIHDFIFNENLLCISEDGANLIARVTPIAFSISGKSWVNNHAHVLKFGSLECQKFVENYINFIDIKKFLTGMAQPKLNKAKLDSIPIPLPPTNGEQQKIADCLSSLDERIEAQEAKIAALREHKKGLMQQLFPRCL